MRQTAKNTVRRYFKNDSGEPFELTDSQADIYLCIVIRTWLRIEVIASTQFGKSSVVAMALIIASTESHELFAIVTGSEPKSQIIMEKVIQHTFDHPKFTAKLELDANEPLDKLRRTRNKTHISWKGGGGIRTFTADARNRQRVKESLTGFGAKNVIEDEASLIPNDLQAMIMRMIGGYKDGFLFKIGNPFYRNHFLRTWNSDKYQHIFIDYHTALAEGRYTESFIDEMRDEAFFDVLYECLFPEDDEINESGWRRLLLDKDLESAFDNADLEVPGPKGPPRLGVDVAAGGDNFSAFVLRYDNVLWLLEKNRDPDLMSQVGRIEHYMKEFNIDGAYIGVDDVGVGHGVTNRLAERGIYVNAVKEGSSAVEKDKYANLRAENYWLAAQWVKGGGKIVKNGDFYQLGVVNYKEDSSSRLKIEPKADLAKRGIKSPDVADAVTLTFSNVPVFRASDIDFF